MTALSGGAPERGVRYVFTLVEGDAARAVYDVEVRTHTATRSVRVNIDRAAVTPEGDTSSVAPEHLAQLVALGRTLAKRDDAPWPRRVERWRSPGVR